MSFFMRHRQTAQNQVRYLIRMFAYRIYFYNLNEIETYNPYILNVFIQLLKLHSL